MKGKLTEERRSYIAKFLLDDGAVRASELARKFGVSSETIRKDLIYLEQKGVAKKEYGGAVVASELFESTFMQKSIKNADKKEKIVNQAIKLIAPRSVILMDSGSTVYSLAKLIRHREDITVFTNCLNIAMLLSDSKVRTYISGGEIKNTSKAVVGLWGLEAFKGIKADLAFLGASGFQQRNGPCVENFGEAQMKKQMIQSSRKSIVLADSSKVYQDAMVQYAQWQEIDILITDSDIESSICEDIKRHTKVILA